MKLLQLELKSACTICVSKMINHLDRCATFCCCLWKKGLQADSTIYWFLAENQPEFWVTAVDQSINLATRYTGKCPKSSVCFDI